MVGISGAIALVAFYILLTKKEASVVVPLTALYPALAAILAIVFLKESLTLVKAVGIILSAIALVLLSL
jgi:transporter family protein